MRTERMIIFFLMILLLASLLFLKIQTDKRDKIIIQQQETIMNLTSSFVEYEADKELIKDLRLGTYEK